MLLLLFDKPSNVTIKSEALRRRWRGGGGEEKEGHWPTCSSGSLSVSHCKERKIEGSQLE